MAYFSNGCEGEAFDKECSECAYGQDPCPIAFVQSYFNYDACSNAIARMILDHLVRQGTPEEHWIYKGCAMKELIDKKREGKE